MPDVRDHYGDLLTDEVEEACLAGNLQRVRRRQADTKVWRARLAGSGVTAMVCAALAAMFLPSAQDEPGSPLVVSSPEEARCVTDVRVPCGALAISFSDGSRVTRGDGARLQLLEHDGHHVRSVLHQGWARFSVKPGGPRRWRVDVGPLQVEVIGTAFTVSRWGAFARVAVHHGRVLVRGEQVPEGSVVLGAGEVFSLGAPAADARPANVEAPAAPSVSEATLPVAIPLPLAHPPARRRSGTAVQSHAIAPPSSDAQRALMEADRLRAAGDAARAHELLAGALATDPRGPSAGLIGFSMAQLSLNTLRQPARAARELADAVESGSLSRSLHEQALAQQVEALAGAGLLEQAKSARSRYIAAYPAGRWVEAMARWAPTQ